MTVYAMYHAFDDMRVPWNTLEAATVAEALDLEAQEYLYPDYAAWLADGRGELEARPAERRRPYETCGRCNGYGVLPVGYYGEEPPCPRCGGSGELWLATWEDEEVWE